MIGSVLPASASPITAAPVSLPLIDGMQILTWTGVAYDYTAYDTFFGGWVDSGLNPKPAPNYTVGQGFFFFNPNTTANTWPQTLP
jgi:hypothetical protein